MPQSPTHNSEKLKREELQIIFTDRAKSHKRTAAFFLSLIVLIMLSLVFFIMLVNGQVNDSTEIKIKILKARLGDGGSGGEGKPDATPVFSKTYIDSNSNGGFIFFLNQDSEMIISQKGVVSSVKGIQFKYDSTAQPVDIFFDKHVAFKSSDGEGSDSKNSDIGIRNLITKGIVVFVTIFLVVILFNLYKYHARLARYYLARADALAFMPILKFEDAIKKLSPDTYHIGNPKFSQDHLVELIGLLKESDKDKVGYCYCCKCCCKECNEKKEQDKATSDNDIDEENRSESKAQQHQEP